MVGGAGGHWYGDAEKLTRAVFSLASKLAPAVVFLDEAVIRRMPRRIMVPLPTTPNREKILRVLLGAEELEEGFEWGRVASACEGYSGSDLKNLCVAAAYRPIREVIAKVKGGRHQTAFFCLTLLCSVLTSDRIPSHHSPPSPV